jgi:hypothetical protein
MDNPDLFALSAIEDPSMRRIGTLPSWVPDFSVCECNRPLAFPSFDVVIPYAAWGQAFQS